MTAPNALLSLSVGDLLKQVQTALNDIEAALSLIDKFTVFLPAQYKAPLVELESVLKTVNDFVQKL